jgi:hypothetical protein
LVSVCAGSSRRPPSIVLLARVRSAGGEAHQESVALATAAAQGRSAIGDVAAAQLVHQRHDHPAHRGAGRQPTRAGQGGPDPGRRPPLHHPCRTVPAGTDQDRCGSGSQPALGGPTAASSGRAQGADPRLGRTGRTVRVTPGRAGSAILESPTRGVVQPGLSAPLGTRPLTANNFAPDVRERPGEMPVRMALSLGLPIRMKSEVQLLPGPLSGL